MTDRLYAVGAVSLLKEEKKTPMQKQKNTNNSDSFKNSKRKKKTLKIN